MIRIVCSIDVDASTPAEAYAKLSRRLGLLCARMGWAWETTDEWYDSDGRELSFDEIDAVFKEDQEGY